MATLLWLVNLHFMPPLKKSTDHLTLRQLNLMLLFRCMKACSAAKKELVKKIQTAFGADMKGTLNDVDEAAQ
jgi:hypothetical protein